MVKNHSETALQKRKAVLNRGAKSLKRQLRAKRQVKDLKTKEELEKEAAQRDN